jgi:hypothetical protein
MQDADFLAQGNLIIFTMKLNLQLVASLTLLMASFEPATGAPILPFNHPTRIGSIRPLGLIHSGFKHPHSSPKTPTVPVSKSVPAGHEKVPNQSAHGSLNRREESDSKPDVKSGDIFEVLIEDADALMADLFGSLRK